MNDEKRAVNCGDTEIGLRELGKWLGNTRWDVIHFNWGLWDLCYRHPDSKVYGNRDKINGTISVPLEKYKENLETLVSRLKKSGEFFLFKGIQILHGWKDDSDKREKRGKQIAFLRAGENTGGGRKAAPAVDSLARMHFSIR